MKNTAVRYHTGNCFYVLKKLSPHRMVMLLFSLAVYSFVTLLFFFLESPFSVLKFWYYWLFPGKACVCRKTTLAVASLV